ncbi:sulfotransferase [uncultured Sphingosinicella sp.]|uniref:tetratricopeptide repeat-containing sulfotransferase family protein n=1 Tax=uncultured Sphingosinicella sp. TaxID=478748 RepID=UPI0030DA6BE5|tara:strand:+ start:12327 stop:14099 length:1773 start_codon:yes stop_codon:yes gene_type:complete
MSTVPDLSQRAERARTFLKTHPGNADALRALGAALRGMGEEAAAEEAELGAIQASTRDPVLVEAAAALLDNNIPIAERILRARLKEKPTDVAAIRMMAEIAGRLGRYGDAEKLLRRALELAPAFGAARANLATVLYRQNNPADAVAELDRLLSDDPDNAAHRNLKAAALGRIGGYEEAIALYESVLATHPAQPRVWMSYGHVLKTVGRQADSIAAYRKAIERAPGLGEVWWSLANLKTVQFTDADMATMRAALESDGISEDDRFHLHFALGKALEDAKDHAGSFGHYLQGNALRKAMLDYDSGEISGLVREAAALMDAAFFAERKGQGDPAPDPIFVLGMPRAGSTLIEQILSSHPMIEGTQELPDIAAMARRLGGRKMRGEETAYPACLADLSADALAELGAEYLERTRIQRKTERPLFIDKMPNNWAHTGFIHLILPNAKIIDARRHPLGCCFSNFKQHFARGQGFSYDLPDLGRYYRDYVAMMAVIDDALPGRVHRVFYEDMVENTEGEVRRLLDYVGVPFDPACLRFFENDRAVRTASSEQVRRPINRDGMEQWQAFEPWLEPLKTSLGPVLTAYPGVPPVASLLQ